MLLEPLSFGLGLLLGLHQLIRCPTFFYITLGPIFFDTSLFKLVYYMFANKRYVLASRTICLTDDTAPINENTVETTAIMVFPQNIKLFLEGLNVTL